MKKFLIVIAIAIAVYSPEQGASIELPVSIGAAAECAVESQAEVLSIEQKNHAHFEATGKPRQRAHTDFDIEAQNHPRERVHLDLEETGKPRQRAHTDFDIETQDNFNERNLHSNPMPSRIFRFISFGSVFFKGTGLPNDLDNSRDITNSRPIQPVRKLDTQVILEHLQHSSEKIVDYFKCVGIICKRHPVFTFANVVSVIINNSIDCYFVYLSTVHIKIESESQVRTDGNNLLVSILIGSSVLLCTERLSHIMATKYEPAICQAIQQAISSEEITPVGRFNTMARAIPSEIGMLEKGSHYVRDTNEAIAELSKHIILMPKHCAEFMSTLGMFIYCGCVIEKKAPGQGYTIIGTSLLLALASAITNMEINKAEHESKRKCVDNSNKICALRTCMSVIEFSCIAAQILSFTELYDNITIDNAVIVLGVIHSFEPVMSSILRRYTILNRMMIEIFESYSAYQNNVTSNFLKAVFSVQRSRESGKE